MKKYIIWPWGVTSKRDGDEHYIPGDKLIRFYGLNPTECIIVNREEDLLGVDTEGMLDLYPDYSGKYELPKPEQNTLII